MGGRVSLRGGDGREGRGTTVEFIVVGPVGAAGRGGLVVVVFADFWCGWGLGGAYLASFDISWISVNIVAESSRYGGPG